MQAQTLCKGCNSCWNCSCVFPFKISLQYHFPNCVRTAKQQHYRRSCLLLNCVFPVSLQAGASDFVAVTLALTAASCLPRKQLYRDKPAVCMSTRATFLQIAVSTVLRFGAQAGVAALLCSQSWFTGGTGNADQVGQPPLGFMATVSSLVRTWCAIMCR